MGKIRQIKALKKAFKRNQQIKSSAKTKSENIFGRDLRVFSKTLKEGLMKSAEVLQEKMQENASLTDHTLKDLAAMGHPYSVRNPANPHDPPYLIHEQTGDLKNQIEITESPKGFSLTVGVDGDKVPYLPYLIHGTSKMIPRNFISESYREALPDMILAMESTLETK